MNGQYNVFIGDSAGGSWQNYITGSYNTAVGVLTLNNLSGGTDNVAIGSNTGIALTDGNNNTFVGAGSGKDIITGSGNTFFGYKAGYKETGSNKLFITNNSTNNEVSDRSSALIYGEYDNSLLRINGDLEINLHQLIIKHPSFYQSQFIGYTYSSLPASLTEYPNSSDWGFHEDDNLAKVHLVFNYWVHLNQ